MLPIMHVEHVCSVEAAGILIRQWWFSTALLSSTTKSLTMSIFTSGSDARPSFPVLHGRSNSLMSGYRRSAFSSRNAIQRFKKALPL